MDIQSIGNFVLFQGGEFVALDDNMVPATILEAVHAAVQEDQIDPCTSAHLAKAGGLNVESYGCRDEMVEVYKVGPFWYVEHFNETRCDARIVIRFLPDFLTFQAKWLAPMAQKIMAKITMDEWRTVNHEALETATLNREFGLDGWEHESVPESLDGAEATAEAFGRRP